MTASSPTNPALERFDAAMKAETDDLDAKYASSGSTVRRERNSEALKKVRDLIPLIEDLDYHQLSHVDKALSEVMSIVRLYSEVYLDEMGGATEKQKRMVWSKFGNRDPRPRDGHWWGDLPTGGYALCVTRSWNTVTDDPIITDYEFESWELGNEEIKDLAALVEQGWRVWVHAEYARACPGFGMSVSISDLDLNGQDTSTNSTAPLQPREA